MEYKDNKLVVDELIYDPSLPNGVIVRIDASYYLINDAYTNEKIPEDKLKPYKKPVDKDWVRTNRSWELYTRNMIPRNGYQVNVGRAATPEEFAEICKEYNLVDCDVSDIFADTIGKIYGKDYEISFSARQITVENSAAVEIEEKLKKAGIEAGNVAPGRVTIRV